jgi:cell division protein FtsW (lipid II flippase)
MVEGEFGRAFRELGFPGGFLLIYLVAHMLIKGFVALSRVQPREWRYVSAGLYGVMVSGVLGFMVGPALYLMPVAALLWLAYAGLLRLAEPEVTVAAAAPATVAARAA